MSEITCFMIEQVAPSQARRSFRRYVSGTDGKCEKNPVGFHNVEVTVVAAEAFEKRRVFADCEAICWGDGRPATYEEKLDAIWPKTCVCGFAFRETDEWQVNRDLLFFKPGEPERTFTLEEAPAGSMWNADWWPMNPKPYDGVVLCVRLPDGNDWMPDEKSKDGRPWTRSGTLPKVTCTPSILTPGYHGFLTDGVLRSC